MSQDIVEQIDETLTFYSAGLGEDVTVPVERNDALSIQGLMSALDELALVWRGPRQAAARLFVTDNTEAVFLRSDDDGRWRELTDLLQPGSLQLSGHWEDGTR